MLGYIFCELQVPRSHNLNPVKTLYVDDLCAFMELGEKSTGTKMYLSILAVFQLAIYIDIFENTTTGKSYNSVCLRFC